jgi:hypothetical protein
MPKPIRWFLDLPTHRKVLLFLAGGMLTLVFDAFIAHWSWNRASMKWNQWPPVAYGLFAFAVLQLMSLRQFKPKSENFWLNVNGALGIVIGLVGVYFHVVEVVASMEGEELTIISLGKTLAATPPVFAPAAYTGVGLLLMVLKRITGAHAVEKSQQKTASIIDHPMRHGAASSG